MGFTEPCFRDTPEEIIHQALGIDSIRPRRPLHQPRHGAHHLRRSQAARPHPARLPPRTRSQPFLPYTSGPLPTPSGKVEFYSESLAAAGLDPLPAFTPPTESRWGADAERYPLELLARKADNYMNSTFANLDGHRKMEARTNQRLEMHPADAAARNIADGDPVRIFNDRGSLHLTAMSTPACPPASSPPASTGPNSIPTAPTSTPSPANASPTSAPAPPSTPPSSKSPNDSCPDPAKI